MKAMKTKYYILGVLTILCLLGTGYYAWTLYDACRKQVAEWNEAAKATFDEALWMEVDKRSSIPFYLYSSFPEGMTTLKQIIPDTVRVITSTGFRKFKIDRYKYDHSLIKETMRRGGLGALLNKFPLSVDTLGMRWDSLLVNNHVFVKSRIRYIYTDEDLQNDTVFTAKKGKSTDSLTVRYLGFRCEHELVGYVSYPFGLSMLSVSEWGFLLLPWCVWGLLFAFYAPLERFVRKKIIREKVVEKEVIVEKEIYMVDVRMNKVGIFHLPDGTVFDSLVGTLTKDGVQQRLQPQSVSLLKLFLRKEDRQVTSEEICMKLWGDTGYMDRLRSAISRLRNDFKAVRSELFVSCSCGVYELEFPISSKDSEN